MKDEILKKSYLNAFDIKDKYIKDMLIVITKSLVDDAKQRCVKIDDNRLRDELIYYKFYGEKINDLNIINILLPIIISNTNIQRSEDEVLKTIKNYTLYNKKEEYLSEYILGSLIYNTLIHSIIDNKNIEYNDLMQNIKTRIIEFIPNLEKLGFLNTITMDDKENVDAYYIDEGIRLETSKPFYQKNNPQSMCELIEDKVKFNDDLNNRIQHFIHSSNNDLILSSINVHILLELFN